MRPSRVRLIALIALSAAHVACGQVEQYDDQGTVCIGEIEAWDTGAEVSIEAGAAAPVTVVFTTCASGSTEWKNQSCSVVSSGGQVEVSASARSRTPRTQTDDCNWIDLDCGTVTLDEGEHTLVFGDQERSFAVPYAGPAVCVDAG